MLDQFKEENPRIASYVGFFDAALIPKIKPNNQLFFDRSLAQSFFSATLLSSLHASIR